MQVKFDIGLLAHILFECSLRPNAFGCSPSNDGPRIFRLGESVEVKAGASELRGKESRIGVGDLPDRVETNCLKARLGFRPDAPKAGYGKRSKPRFGVVRRNEGQAIRLL